MEAVEAVEAEAADLKTLHETIQERFVSTRRTIDGILTGFSTRSIELTLFPPAPTSIPFPSYNGRGR